MNSEHLIETCVISNVDLCSKKEIQSLSIFASHDHESGFEN